MSHAYQQHLDFRYAGRYKPPVPAATRAAVIKRANRRCESCGETSPLELHHRHYATEGRETPDDLAAFCRDCHLRAHLAPNGVFYVDPQEKEVEWATFDKGD